MLSVEHRVWLVGWLNINSAVYTAKSQATTTVSLDHFLGFPFALAFALGFSFEGVNSLGTACRKKM